MAFLLPVTLEAATITHGPVLGGLTATSVKVWARTDRPGEFQVRYGSEPETLNRIAGPARTESGRDNTGVVQIAGLQPGTKYFYRLAGGQGGSFQTLPDTTSARSPLNPRGLFNFSFEYACGNQQRIDPTLPAFRTMLKHLKDRIHFAILNGDWLYEEKREYSFAEWRRQVGLSGPPPRLLEIVPSITGVWENYKLYLERGKPLAAWHREIPSFFTFDDHELLADVNGCGTVGLRNRRAAFRDVGVEAWNHYLGWSNPRQFQQRITFGKATLKAGSGVIEDAEADFTQLNLAETGTLMVQWGEDNDAVFDPELDDIGGDPNAGVYEIVEVLDAHRLRIRPAAKTDSLVSYSTGEFSHYRMRVSNAEFFVLDTRSHRQLHDTRDPFKEGVSMLGTAQKRWLKEGMRASDADFFFVVSSVNLMIPHVHPKQPDKDEAWTAIAGEREELIEFWDSLDKPVFVLTGDLHNSMAIRVTPRVWEFASGPHNSGNHPAWAESDRPANGRFTSRGRECEIRWSTHFENDSSPRRQPVYCVVQVNNVQNNPVKGTERLVAYPRPQVVFQYYNGFTGELLYAESVLAAEASH